jgi:hypothetical protein
MAGIVLWDGGRGERSRLVLSEAEGGAGERRRIT